MSEVYDYSPYFHSKVKLEPIQVLTTAYRDYDRLSAGNLEYPEKASIFRKIAEILWGPDNKTRKFIWHPWAEIMNARVHKHPVTGQMHPHVALNGCGSSGKTEYGAIYAIINWLCDPLNTLAMATTTDLNAGQRRIWGAIEKYFSAAPRLPGKLVSSVYRINTVDRNGNKAGGQCGIILVPGEKKKEKDCLEKLIGSKAGKRMILIADELPDLVMAIVETFFGNLITSSSSTQMVAMGNFSSRYDAFGVMCRPKDGWDSIDVSTTEWESVIVLPETTSKIPAWCVRFDGMQSPNLTGGQDIYPIYGIKHLKQHRELGDKSAQFWRFCRSFEAPVGISNNLYTESDFRAGQAYERVVWRSNKIAVSGLDPAIKTGGDRVVQYFGWYGQDVGGRWVLEIDHYEVIREDVTRRDEPFDLQVAKQAIDNCIRLSVAPENFAVDATGTGAGVYSHIWEKWSPKVLRVEFGGGASESIVVFDDTATAKERYDRRVSELWGVGKEFMRYGQIKGMDEMAAQQMKCREYETKKAGGFTMTKLETKTDMKKRVGSSPDHADAFFVMLDLCRQRLGFLAGGEGAGYQAAQQTWNEQVQAMQEVYNEDALYQQEEYAQVV